MREAKSPKAIRQLRKHLSRELFNAASLSNADGFDTFSTCIQQIADTIEHFNSKESFESAEAEVMFLNHMKWWAAAMTSSLENWEALQELYEEMEISCAKKCFFTPSKKAFCFKTLPWAGFAPNRAKPRTPDILAQAEKKGLDVNLRLQRLPRGCITIVELWRKNVSAVVDSILQVIFWGSSCGSNHETLSANQHTGQGYERNKGARCKWQVQVHQQDFTNKLQAGMQESFFLLERDEKAGRTRRLLQPILAPNIKVIEPYFTDGPCD